MNKLQTLVAAMNASGFSIIQKNKTAGRAFIIASDEAGVAHFINSNAMIAGLDANGQPTGYRLDAQGNTMYAWVIGKAMEPTKAEAAPFPTEPVAGEQLTLGL